MDATQRRRRIADLDPSASIGTHSGPRWTLRWNSGWLDWSSPIKQPSGTPAA